MSDAERLEELSDEINRLKNMLTFKEGQVSGWKGLHRKATKDRDKLKDALNHIVDAFRGPVMTQPGSPYVVRSIAMKALEEIENV